MRRVFVFAVVSSALAIIGCYSAPETSTPTPTPVVATPTPTATPVQIAVATPTPAITSTRTIKNRDGSTTVESLHVDGSKTEVRTFPATSKHNVARVTRTTSSTGTMRATVTNKDDTSGELTDESMTEKAMTATGDALETAGKTTVSGVKTAADATEKAAVTAGKATAEGAKTAASETAKGAEKVGKATVEGTKKVGEATAKGAEAAGKATVEGAKKVGEVFTGKKKATPTPKAN